MIKCDEFALICDLAETYQIYDYKTMPPLRVAIFAAGLRENSRIKMKMSKQKVPLETTLIAGISDSLNTLVWMNSADGQKGRNRPTLITSLLSEQKEKSETVTFSSGEDFENYRNNLIAKIGGERNGN